MQDFGDILQVCREAAQAGARELLAWRERFSVREKGAADLVTDADLASQNAVRSVIQSYYPEHGFLGEEDSDPDQLELPECWIVDPLDGTTNYVHDFPCFAVSVAYARQGKLAVGAILDPLGEECFTAAAGGGAFLNDRPIAVSNTTVLGEALVAVSFPPRPMRDAPDIQAFLEICPRCQAVRRTGSAALNLAYVACGRLDAHWAHFIHSWDSAAGVLLVEEAGGTVTAYSGGPYDLARGDYFVTATESLRREIIPLLSPYQGK